MTRNNDDDIIFLSKEAQPLAIADGSRPLSLDSALDSRAAHERPEEEPAVEFLDRQERDV